MRIKPTKYYIGDGVYVEFDGYRLVLTTEDGLRTTNEIVLEPQVLASLERYMAQIRQQQQQTA